MPRITPVQNYPCLGLPCSELPMFRITAVQNYPGSELLLFINAPVQNYPTLSSHPASDITHNAMTSQHVSHLENNIKITKTTSSYHYDDITTSYYDVTAY